MTVLHILLGILKIAGILLGFLLGILLLILINIFIGYKFKSVYSKKKIYCPYFSKHLVLFS